MECEIIAHSWGAGLELQRIARHCGMDLGTSFDCKVRVDRNSGVPAHLTLKMDVAEIAESSTCHCLACRIACFCPKARVSVLISADRHFAGAGPEPADGAARQAG